MALTQTQVSQLYVSIFNRASEGAGNEYWQSQPDMATAASIMLETDAAQDYFGASLDTDQAFIEHIYLNTFNKTTANDPDGIAYWVGELAGGKTRGEVVATLISVVEDYADSTDPATIVAYNQFMNRVEVSNYMADEVDEAPADWPTSTAFGPGGLDVTDDPDSVDAAIADIEYNWVPPEYTMTASATSVYEGVDITYTITGDKPVLVDTVVEFSVVPGIPSGDDDQGTNLTNLNDFIESSFNPFSVIIPAGSSTATYTVSAIADATTEFTETYGVQAVIDGEVVATRTTTLLDGAAPPPPADETAPVFNAAPEIDALNEDAALGTVVATVSATDDNTITYSLDNAKFAINAAGVITLAQALDYEDSAVENIVVTATDAAGNASTQTLAVVVNDVDEAPVFNNVIQPAAHNENAIFAAGTVIATAAAADPEGTVVTYAIDDARFAIDGDGVITLVNDTIFDFETESSISLVATATDEGGLETTQTLTLTINDRNVLDEMVTDTGNDTVRLSIDTDNAPFEGTAGVVGGTLIDAEAYSDNTGLEVLRVVGNANIRVDMTNPNNQIKGLDLNGNGAIATDAVENNLSAANVMTASNFTAFDFYARNPLNTTDRANNYLGQLRYDGTGFDGDGVNSDGNIVLGGLGADIILGGIGNDFLAGGGSISGNDSLSGGRNADFFFVELSLLDPTDGNGVLIDGGLTSDDAAVGNNTPQDTDWLLLEASDDDEPVVVNLAVEDNQSVTTRAGQSATLKEIENVDASGNLYGFLDGMDVAIGGRAGGAGNTNPVNYGIGSTAQLHIIGSSASNRLIGGYDNDRIEGSGGDDLLMGGNMQFLLETLALGRTNPNLPNIINDGMDFLYGGAGDDSIMFEMDGGVIDGGAGNDTLWLTDYTVSRPAATEADSAALMLSDERIRLDLGYESYRGYRYLPNDPTNLEVREDTADQSNYINEANAVEITGMENINATGLGGIDFLAAGSNDPDLTFANQQNFRGSSVDMDLRGTDGTLVQGSIIHQGMPATPADLTEDQINVLFAQFLASWQVAGQDGDDILDLEGFKDLLEDGGLTVEPIAGSEDIYTWTITGGSNILYAGTGDDVLEGRAGNDLLEGNEGNDDFVFFLGAGEGSVSSEGAQESAVGNGHSGDGVDVIHRLLDLNVVGGDGIWDAAGGFYNDGYGRDFGLDSSLTQGESVLRIDIAKAGGNAAGDELADVVNFVSQITTGVEVGGVFETIVLATPEIQAATTYASLTDAINNALDATVYGDDLEAVLQADGHTIFITDVQGRELADSISEVAGAGVYVNQKANTATANIFEYGEPEIQVSQDRLIYKAYEDRLDNEGVDDDAIFGSTISLGIDNYAQDLVINFSADGTRIAEDQQYQILFDNLTTQDLVTITVNGVEYQLQVGKDLDGTLLADENTLNTSQTDIQTNFLARYADFINSFMDDDTAAGMLTAVAGSDRLIITQTDYNGEETVFMTEPIVAIQNLSGGERAVYDVINTSSHELFLLEFDGRNNALNRDNVLFWGQEEINRAVLETAKATGGAMNGFDAMLVDAGANTLAGYDNNIITQFNTDFSVHGDDLLLGGVANDTIMGLTGDDRILGSLGNDILDGGKDYYAVKFLGEAEARVFILNTWEAANPSQVPEIAALQGQGEIISSINLIAQSEDGYNLISGNFQDTLQYQQADFTPGVSRFTVTLDMDYYSLTGAGVLELPNGGAGTVGVDADGNGIVEGGNVSVFTNFENIRTVSGVDRAVAGDGQGYDTLDVAEMSTATGGILYNLTNGGEAGKVEYSVDDFITAGNLGTAIGDRPAEADYESLVLRVDGVENVIGGLGDDMLIIDETEAAKDNLFDADLGVDRIYYNNDFGTDAAEPVVTIKVNTAADTDEVEMTNGRLGTTVATDILKGVEFIALYGNTAQGVLEADVLDVTAMTAGAVVDYTNGEIRTSLLANTGVQVVVENLVQVENVWADGNDTVIVADADIMNNNARSDEIDPLTDLIPGGAIQPPLEDIALATFLDYDEFDGAGQRIAFLNQTTAQITDVINQNQFTFDLSRVGVDADVDTVDYSNELGDIVAVMNFIESDSNKFILVDGDSDGSFIDAESRVDKLVGVERIAASQGDSIIDVTNSDRDLNISFSYNMPSMDTSFVEGTHKITALDRQINLVRVADAGDQAALGNVDLLEYRDLGDNALVNQPTATWNTVEGSDYREYVELTQWEDGINHTFNLRAGANEVNYNERTNGIWLTIDDFDTNDNEYLLSVMHLDETGVQTGFFDTVTSYNQNHAIGGSDNALRIEASQGDMDLIDVSAVAQDGLFLLGEVESSGDAVVSALFEGEGTGLVMSGFEWLWDGIADDTYEIGDLSNFVSKITLIDYNQVYNAGTGAFEGSTDRDTIKLTNDSFETAVIKSPIAHSITINNDLRMGDGTANDLQWLGVNNIDYKAKLGDGDNNAAGGTSVGFDFQVLDISEVTNQIDITAVGLAGDELIVGGLNYLDDADVAAISGFTILSLTNNSLGSSFDFDLDAGEFQTASNVNIATFDALTTLDLSRITGRSMTITVTDDGAAGATVIGTESDDTITGGAGTDVITGGEGADTLDGSFVPEVQEVQTIVINGGFMADGIITGTIDIAGITYTEAAAYDPVALTLVDGSDADTIGAIYAAIAVADYEIALGLNPGELDSVTYDAVANTLSFTFASGFNAVDGSVLVGSGGYATGAGPDGGAIVIGAGVDTAYAAQGDSSDTFVYLTIDDSTQTDTDSILNFEDLDVINFAALDLATLTGNGVAAEDEITNNGVIANFGAALDAIAADFFDDGSDDNAVAVVSDGTNARVYVDVNGDGDLDAGDMQINLIGLATTAFIDAIADYAF